MPARWISCQAPDLASVRTEFESDYVNPIAICKRFFLHSQHEPPREEECIFIIDTKQ